MQTLVYEPFQHFIPTGRGWVEGFQGLGHVAYELPSHQYSILDVDQEIDVLVLFGPDQSKSSDIIEFKRRYPKCKIILVCFGYQPWYSQIEESISLWVEHTYKHDIAKEQFESRGLKFANIPLAASRKKFFPIKTDPQFDVSFVGSFSHGSRNEEDYLFPVIDKGYKGFYSGFSYKGVQYPYVNHNSLNQLYNSTKVNLNFHYWDQKQQSISDITCRLDFNGRVFEIAMAGAFQVCDLSFAKDYHFGDSIVVANKHDWLDTIEFYLDNDVARLQKQSAAFKIAMEHHTWENRMQDVINLLA